MNARTTVRIFRRQDRHEELQSVRTRRRSCQPINRLLLAIGGEIYNKTYLNSVDCYHVDDNRWLRLKELPFARCHHGCVVSAGKYIYVTGTLTGGHPSSVVRRPSSVVRRPSSVVRRPSSVVRRPSSVVRRPSSVVRRPSSVVRRPSSVVRRPSSVVRRPSSVVRRPSSVVRRP